MVELLYREQTGKTLKGYYVVYNGTSRNYPEYIYENGLVKVMDKDWMRYRGIRLGILTNFYDTTIQPVFIRI